MKLWKWRLRTHRYRSEIDGAMERFRVYRPRGYRRGELYPLVILLHGFGGDEEGMIGEEVASLADEYGYLLMAPRGRGNVFYDGVGEEEFLRAFEETRRHYGVDEDRIYLLGSSMGGTGAWRLATRYPHLFAGVVPICGWTDWRLWYRKWYASRDHPEEVPEWRVPLLERASALPLAVNLLNLPVCILHGARDRTVSVIESRRMYRALRRIGAEVVYKEYARSGHSAFRTRWRAIFDWFEGRPLRSWLGERYVGGASRLGTKRRALFPTRVIYRTNSLRHNRGYWVRIDDLAAPNEFGEIAARIVNPGRVRVSARGVRGFTLLFSLSDGWQNLSVEINGRKVTTAQSPILSFHMNEEGAWSPGCRALPLRKRPGLTGPLADAFNAPFLLVPGESGEEHAEAHWFARAWERWMMPLDKQGRPCGKCELVSHNRLRDEQIRHFNLILFGRPHTHSFLARIAAHLPIEIKHETVRIGARLYSGPSVGLRMIAPNPLNPERYVVVWFGHMPMRIKDLECWPWLLPDYVVFDARIPCGRTVHPYWEAFDKKVAAGDIRPEEVPEEEHPPLHLPDCFLEAGFFDEEWGVSESLSARQALS